AQRHAAHFGKDSPDVLIVQAPSSALNPTIDPAIIVNAKAEDAASYRSEWMAEFRTDISSLLADDVIDAAIDMERPVELPPLRGVRYRAFVDASAGRHDAFTICIAHTSGDQRDDQ